MEYIVKPDNWVLPNRIGYNKEIYNTFNPVKYLSNQDKAAKTSPSCKCTDNSCDLEDNYIKLLRQQK